MGCLNILPFVSQFFYFYFLYIIFDIVNIILGKLNSYMSKINSHAYICMHVDLCEHIVAHLKESSSTHKHLTRFDTSCQRI